MDQNVLRNQISNPSSHILDILAGWEKISAAPYRLNVGREVKILFLKSKPVLNGKIGRIVGWKEERCIVKLEGNEEYALKRSNLLPTGIRDKKSGQIIAQPLTEDRVRYVLEGGDEVDIENLEFNVGTPVVLRNLSVTKWNGEGGQIQTAMDEEKYLVFMNSRETLKLKHSKLYL